MAYIKFKLKELDDEIITFKAYVTSLTDSIKSNNKQMENTLFAPGPKYSPGIPTRTVNVSFDVIAESQGEAVTNLLNISKLANYIFGYVEDDAPKLAKLGIKYYNLLCHGSDFLFSSVPGFDFKPETEAGFYVSGTFLYPKLIKVSISLEILPDDNGDSRAKDGMRFDNWPYAVSSKTVLRTKVVVPKPPKPSAAGAAGAQADEDNLAGEANDS